MDEDGFERVGPNGKRLDADHLWELWTNEKGFNNPGHGFERRLLFEISRGPHHSATTGAEFWQLPVAVRVTMIETWRDALMEENQEKAARLYSQYLVQQEEYKASRREGQLQGDI